MEMPYIEILHRQPRVEGKSRRLTLVMRIVIDGIYAREHYYYVQTGLAAIRFEPTAKIGFVFGLCGIQTTLKLRKSSTELYT